MLGGMAEPNVLSPAARPRRRPPRWAIVVLISAAFVDSVARVFKDPPDALETFSVIGGFAAVVALAMWLEERLYLALCSRPSIVQLILTAMLPIGGLSCGVFGAVMAEKLLKAEALVPVFLVGGFWMSSAAIGTTVVLAVDLVGRIAASRFASRIRLAVLGLIAVWGTVLAGIAVVIPRTLAKLLATSPDSIQINDAGHRMTAEEIRKF